MRVLGCLFLILPIVRAEEQAAYEAWAREIVAAVNARDGARTIELIDFACGRDWLPGDRTVDVLVARLRRHLPPEVAEIVTVHRAGYLFLFRDRPAPSET